MSKILTAGTFDYFHIGHQYYLYMALAKAQQMTIIVARDKTVARVKGSFPQNDETARLAKVEQEFQDFQRVKVRLGREDGDFLKTLKEENPDILWLGYDQKFRAEKGAIPPHIKIKKGVPYQPNFFKSSRFKS